MKPYGQGYLDSLCGIYGIINATRIISNKMHIDESVKLFKACMKHVENRKSLVKICTIGVDTNDMKSILKNIVSVKCDINVKKPFRKKDEITVSDFCKEIRRYFDQGGNRSVIISIECDDWEHWTVIKYLSTKKMVLFDSALLKTIAISKCTFKKKTKRKPYLITPHETFFLYRREN